MKTQIEASVMQVLRQVPGFNDPAKSMEPSSSLAELYDKSLVYKTGCEGSDVYHRTPLGDKFVNEAQIFTLPD